MVALSDTTRRNAHAATALFLLALQVGASIANRDSALLHLTYWITIADILYHAFCAISHVAESRLITDIFHLPITQATWFVAGAMLGLSLQDDAVVIHAEAQLGVVVAGLGNFAFHFLPPLINTCMLIEFPETFMGWYNSIDRTHTVHALIVLPAYIPAIYASIHNPHKQYEGDFNERIVLASGAVGMVVGAIIPVATRLLVPPAPHTPGR